MHSSAIKLKARSKNESAGADTADYSLVDFNRAGIPLMELVTEPVIHSAEEAGSFARELQLLLRTLGVADANMEKGEMRVEANVSVSKGEKLGTKTEVKNINSFRAAEKAIEFEIKRQIGILEGGAEVVQETRGWDDMKGETFSQREKEESHDYRYFPDPDLPKLKLSEIDEFSIENLQKEIPELPWEMRERYGREYGIKEEDVETFVQDKSLRNFFEEVIAESSDKDLIQKTANYITSDLVGLMKDDPALYLSSPLPYELKIRPTDFRKLIEMVNLSKLSSRGAKDILAIMYKEGGDPEKIAEEKKMLQTSDEEELVSIVEKIIEDHFEVVEEYRNGKESAVQFFVGQGMKETKGSANPQILKSIFEKLLKN
jgi:aspartyl-tRNA(Asn)/glutamyl-tRNA(Gln) amidotransferase subunit B